jgi:hypothetical protein
MNKISPEFDDEDTDRNGSTRMIGSLVVMLIFFAIMAVAVLALTSCGSTFYGADGKPTARITGDLTYARMPDGGVTMTINHSQVIDAQARAIGAVGSSLTALAIAAP